MHTRFLRSVQYALQTRQNTIFCTICTLDPCTLRYVLLTPILCSLWSSGFSTNIQYSGQGGYVCNQPTNTSDQSVTCLNSCLSAKQSQIFFFKPHHNYLEIRYWYLIVYNCRHKNNCSFSIHPSCSSHSTVHSDFYLWEHRTIWRTGGVIAKATIVFLVPM